MPKGGGRRLVEPLEPRGTASPFIPTPTPAAHKHIHRGGPESGAGAGEGTG